MNNSFYVPCIVRDVEGKPYVRVEGLHPLIEAQPYGTLVDSDGNEYYYGINCFAHREQAVAALRELEALEASTPKPVSKQAVKGRSK